MKYVRVFDGCDENEYITIHEEHCESVANMQNGGFDFEGCIVKQADTIEELCDCFIKIKRKGNLKQYILKFDHKDLPTLKEKATKRKDNLVYGAIHVEGKGLIYAAKMNEKGEFELLC